MGLTPKHSGGASKPKPLDILNSALIEGGFSASPVLTSNATISVWVKPTGTILAPMADQTNHYHLLISKAGTVVSVFINGAYHSQFNGTIGATFHELLKNVLTAYAGSHKAYYSELHAITDKALPPEKFIMEHPDHTGFMIPVGYRGSHGTGSYLDFSNALNLGTDIAGANNWTISGEQTVDVPTNNYVTLKLLIQSGWTGSMSSGNRDASFTTSGGGRARTNIPMPSSGKYYVEARVLTRGDYIAVGDANGSSFDNFVHPESTGNDAGIVFNMDTMVAKYYRNGEYVTQKNLLSSWLYAHYSDGTSKYASRYFFRSGSTGFMQTIPSGAVPLCANNLPDNHPDKYRNAVVS